MNFKTAMLNALGITKNANTQSAVVGRASIKRFSIDYAQSTPQSLVELKQLGDLDENLNLAGNSIAEGVAGNGLEIFIEGKLKGGQPLHENIKDKAHDLCSNFSYENDLDTFNLETCAEYIKIGVSLSEKIHDGVTASLVGRRDLVKIARLPIDDNWLVDLPAKAGGPDFVKAYRLSHVNEIFTPDDLMLWRTNHTSASEWYGRGLAWYMAQEKTYTLHFSDETSKTYKMPALFVTLWALQDDLRLAAHNMLPKTIFNAPGQTESWVNTNSELIAQMNGGDALLMSTAKGQKLEVAQSQADPRFRLEALLNWYDQVLIRSLQAPSMAIYSKDGYSGVFAEQVLNQFARKITALKRYHARRLEREVFAQILRQNGIDPTIYRPRVYWRPDTKMISQLQDYVALFTNAITSADFTPHERREIYRRYGAPISSTPPETVTQQQTQPSKQQPAPNDDDKNDSDTNE